MSDPERLLDGSLPPDVARLLGSAASDEPKDPAAKQRKLLAFAAATSPWAARTAAPTTPKSFRTVSWIGLAAVALVGGAMGFRALSQGPGPGDASSPTSAPVVAASVDTPEAPAPLEATNASATPAKAPGESATTAPSLRVDELPTAKPTSAASAPARPFASPSSGAQGSGAQSQGQATEDELAAIDAARAALTAGDAANALDRVTRYKKTFRAPQFLDEADALEVQALARLGRTDEARAKADRFVEVHPRSPYTQRVRSAVRD